MTCLLLVYIVYFQLCLRKKKKEDSKIEIVSFTFLDLVKVCRTFTVDLALELPRAVVCKLLRFPASFFLVAAPIPYVQAAI